MVRKKQLILLPTGPRAWSASLRFAVAATSVERRVMRHTAYELHVQLRHVEPSIWRTLEVPGSATLEDVHYAIQLAMGWRNSHLHQFTIGKCQYGMVDVDEIGDLEDERAHALQDVAKSGSSFLYEYDFGDGWEHDVAVRRVSVQTKPVRPRCLAGARACPPEDCGGPPGYAHLLEVVADRNHEEHEELHEWLPEGFEPERYVESTKDLTRDIGELRRLADEDDLDPFGYDGNDLLGSLPRSLVEQVLALTPMHRATLAAILAGSLADQLTSVVEQLEEAAHARPKSTKKQATSSPRPRRGRRRG